MYFVVGKLFISKIQLSTLKMSSKAVHVNECLVTSCIHKSKISATLTVVHLQTLVLSKRSLFSVVKLSCKKAIVNLIYNSSITFFKNIHFQFIANNNRLTDFNSLLYIIDSFKSSSIRNAASASEEVELCWKKKKMMKENKTKQIRNIKILFSHSQK